MLAPWVALCWCLLLPAVVDGWSRSAVICRSRAASEPAASEPVASVRVCSATDAKAVIELCYSEYATADDPVDNAFLGALLRWGWRARLARPEEHCVLGAFDAGALVGVVELSFRPDDTLAPPVPPPALFEALARRGGGGGGAPYVSNLLVATDRRRRGIARDLMDAAEARAGETGHGRVTLHVDASAAPAAAALYENRGYAVVRKRPAFEGLMAAGATDAPQLSYMIKQLTPERPGGRGASVAK